MLPGDLVTESDSPMHRGDEFLRVHELRLELDDEQAPRLRVPGEDVDDATLAVDRAKLTSGSHVQPSSVPRSSRDGLMHVRMLRVQHPIEVGALPPQPDVDPDTQSAGDGPSRIRVDIDRLRPPRVRLTSWRATPARRATSAWRRRLRTRMARRVLPMRTSSMPGMRGRCALHCALGRDSREGARSGRYHG